MMSPTHRILWLDCLGALAAGAVVLGICEPLSKWEGLPLGVVVFTGVANLVYGVYSLYVTTRMPRPRRLVTILAVGNMAWLGVCVAIVVAWWPQITPLGILLVLGEGIYVAGLGLTEWRWRGSLSSV